MGEHQHNDLPRVFVSATHEDLEDFRQAAANGVIAAHAHPSMTRYWEAQGKKTSYEICLDEVRKCKVMVVIVAHRYGWEPEQQPGLADERKSMVWLECEAARDAGIEILPMVLDEKADWPAAKKDIHELNQAMQQGTASQALFTRVNRATQRLQAFKDWLRGEGGGIVKYFAHLEELEAKVEAAVRAWRDREGIEDPPHVSQGTVPRAYLEWVKREYGTVELLGLEAQDAHAGRLRQVYVPAVTDRRPGEGGGEAAEASNADAKRRRSRASADGEQEGPVLLMECLGEGSLFLSGAPGAGKSTFGRWVAWTVANGAVPPHGIAAPEDYAEQLPVALAGRLPVLVELRDFEPDAQVGVHKWRRRQLEQALGAAMDRAHPGELCGSSFLKALEAGKLMLVLDGVDEVPTVQDVGARKAHPRTCLLTGLADALPAWEEAGNRVLVTSRPYGLNDAERLKLGIPSVTLVGMPRPLQTLFIQRWYAATDAGKAQENTQGLIDHLAGKAHLEELTESPLLLTALCIRFAQGQRLPDDLFELYDGLVSSVLYGRYREDGAARNLVRLRLSAIAHGMHVGTSGGRATPSARVGHDEADEHLAAFARLNENVEGGLEAALAQPAQRREQLLSRSGLLLPAGDDRLQFFHLSFQEFLTADYLLRTQRTDDRLLRVMRERGSEKAWRPTLMFLFTGVTRRDPQWGYQLLDAVVVGLQREEVAANPSLAAFAAQCAEVLLKKQMALGALWERLERVALDAIDDAVEIRDRHVLALSLGRQRDPRAGTGLDARGLPDIGWVEVPSGSYLYGDKREPRELETFWLARYPVTNAQFQAFIDARGYEEDRWWDGLAKREASPRAGAWGESNRPRERVSWYDAVAYCRWLSEALGFEVRLPTEWEWERAARGTDGREYPWGAEYENGRANVLDGGRDGEFMRQTTVVGLYRRGRSPYGIEDLSGNVREWCMNEYKQPERTQIGGDDPRVLRGGSWLGGPDDARASGRGGFGPRFRRYYVGFRLCCVSPIAR
ncbi:MAG: SUMF1/EgtB/PvdO family nonheme iron enzyme [Pseudomonadota bacterium]